MSAVLCPAGHSSDSTDYCDVCGLVIPPASATPAAAPVPSATPARLSPPSGANPLDLDTPSAAPAAALECPNCHADNMPKALFCEVCGYDFTTGSLPPPAPAAAPVGPDTLVTPPPDVAPPSPAVDAVATWTVEVWVDPDWYATQDVPEPCPSGGPPAEVALTVRSALVGRHSASRAINPQIDCQGDSGVSRRHAQLTTDGTRWWVEDLQSSNGTFVGAAASALPTDPITPGQRRELQDGDRIYLGAWSRLVVRRG